MKKEIRERRESLVKWDAWGRKELKETLVIQETRATLARLGPLAKRGTKEKRVCLGFLEEKAKQVLSVIVGGTEKLLGSWILALLASRHL